MLRKIESMIQKRLLEHNFKLPLILMWLDFSIQVWMFKWNHCVMFGFVVGLNNLHHIINVRCLQCDSVNSISVHTLGDFHFSRVSHIQVGECLSLFDIILFPKRIQAYSTMRSPNWNIRQRKMSRFCMQCWIKFFL